MRGWAGFSLVMKRTAGIGSKSFYQARRRVFMYQFKDDFQISYIEHMVRFIILHIYYCV